MPVAVELPPGATKPCARPTATAGDITTDVDLMGLAARWKATAICNESKLTAVGEALKRPAP